MSSVVFFKTATDVDDFIDCGRLFHACGPAKVKAHLSHSDRGFGTTRMPADEERSRCLAATAVILMHSSARSTTVRGCVVPYTPRDTVLIRCVVALGASGRPIGPPICGHIFGDGKRLSLQRSRPAEDDPD